MDLQEMILYEDEDILVCRKKAGIPVQSASIQTMDMESMLKNYLQSPYLAVIHRLDQPVEGLVVFAKNPKAAKSLNEQMEQRKIQKYYLAVTEHIPDKKKGILEDFLKKDGRNNISRAVPQGTPGSRRACLEYEVLGAQDGQALLEVRLETGRHHQIRVQTAHAGFPLWGDQKYNRTSVSGRGEKTFPALCAWRLEFLHPGTKKKLRFCTKPQAEIFQKFSGLIKPE